ncbi:AraC family transcriptional regulator [Sedimentibacter sp.]|uniref:AraC family transcriptional regulator n=1 Tax=Sedimentibacter sp. TaxID=1960295 RepID=UPI00289F4D3D|nr:AraC family transcriptional regulator [Sedimentibacter sp.]
MEWISRLNEAVDYIEQNLDKEISHDKLAQIACCSTFHFIRMFSYIADIPLSEYIRRRRLTMAAFDLQTGNDKIVDIALKYGYDSPTAFNRAFQNVHGISPTAAKRQGVSLKAYPRITFKITIKGDSEMNYKIVTKEAFKIAGVKENFSMKGDECFAKIPFFWQETVQSGVIPSILELINREPYGLLGVSANINDNELSYYIAAATDKATPEGMEEYMVPECTWAVFECIGAMPYAIQELQKRIITEWLPTSGYEYANVPDIEVYFEGDQQAPDYKCEVWLPIIKKQ